MHNQCYTVSDGYTFVACTQLYSCLSPLRLWTVCTFDAFMLVYPFFVVSVAVYALRTLYVTDAICQFGILLGLPRYLSLSVVCTFVGIRAVMALCVFPSCLSIAHLSGEGGWSGPFLGYRVFGPCGLHFPRHPPDRYVYIPRSLIRPSCPGSVPRFLPARFPPGAPSPTALDRHPMTYPLSVNITSVTPYRLNLLMCKKTFAPYIRFPYLHTRRFKTTPHCRTT